MFRHRGVPGALPLFTVLLACSNGSQSHGDAVADEDAGVSASPDLRSADADSGLVTLTRDGICNLRTRAKLSDAIGAVGIITFTTDLPEIEAGYVEYGLDEDYGMRAPLQVDQPEHRTLLLGMRQASEYHYRVVASAGDTNCVSNDSVLATSVAPGGIPTVDVTTLAPEQASPGFVITSSSRESDGGGTGPGTGTVVVFDSTGELVWWHPTTLRAISRARMSYDGRWMYARDGNPGGSIGGRVVRVSMDGLVEEDVEVETGHHDFTPTPDGGMLFLTGQGRDGCSRVEKLSDQGELSLLYDLRDAFGESFEAGPDSCHCNSIQYNPSDDSISVSCLVVNAYVKISAAGELLWVLGGRDSHFSGDVQWNRNHGHQMVSPTRILFFNNNGLAGQPQREAVTRVSSLMLELELDLDERTATRSWTYDGGESSQTLGDVQRLPNGNTHVTYSNAGLMHQVDADGNLVQEWDFPRGTGYARHRDTLYGPPPSL